MSKNDSVQPPPGVKLPDKVEQAPKADRVENAPMPIINASSVEQVEKPIRNDEPKREHTWHKVHIDLGQSTNHIRLNEMEFHHGQIATVRDDLLPVLNEVMYNTKMHERVVRGEVSPSGKRLQHGRG